MAQVKRRKKKAERKEDVIRMRVTDDERKALEFAAANVGLTLSAWLRMIALRESRAATH